MCTAAEGLFRRNDLAFAADTEINRSVSREHAHIEHDAARGEYRLFNDRWYRARGGMRNLDRARRHEPGSPPRRRAAPSCEPGDEIHFGRAVVVFEA